jgi:predicted phosphoribosyltransferase
MIQVYPENDELLYWYSYSCRKRKLYLEAREIGERLCNFNKKHIKNNLKNTLVVSLLRGGFIIGYQIAKKLSIPHFPLMVAKISAPHQEELAIGALCFNKIYWEKSILNSLNLPKNILNNQIKKAKEKFLNYCHEFNIKEEQFQSIENKIVILTDDGIATGSTVNSAFLFLKSKKPEKVILAIPVAPSDFKNPGFDQQIILYQDPFLSAVSQYYQNFSQVTNEEINFLIYN